MRRVNLVVVVMASLAACNEDCDEAQVGPDASAGNPGFVPPTEATRANDRVGGVWTDVGEADWTCLDTPSPDQPSVQTLVVSGTLRDYQTGGPLGGATVTAFAGVDLTGNQGMASTSNSSPTQGEFTFNLAMLPAGQTRVGFFLDGPGLGLRNYLVNAYLDPAQATQTRDLDAWSASTVNALAAFLGDQRDPEDGLVAMAIVDCQGRPVSNAVATVSGIPGQATPNADVVTYYFSAGQPSLPVGHGTTTATSGDGMFLVMHPPASPIAFVQVWGFPAPGDVATGQLTLLAELEVATPEGAIVTGTLEPRHQ